MAPVASHENGIVGEHDPGDRRLAYLDRATLSPTPRLDGCSTLVRRAVDGQDAPGEMFVRDGRERPLERSPTFLDGQGQKPDRDRE